MQKFRIAAPTLLPVFRLWLVGLVLLVAISPTDIPASYRFYLALVYLLLFFYPLFSSRYGRMEGARAIQYTGIAFPWALLLLVIQFICIYLATLYYTGANYFTAFTSALSGQNTYGAYQQYFAEANISTSSAYVRGFYAGLLAAAKLIFVFSVINYFMCRRRSFGSAVFVVCACVLYLGFGLARGTFFEVFEVACAILYFWVMTSVSRGRRKITRNKRVVWFFAIAGIVLIGLFILNAMRRYEDSAAFFRECSSNFCFNPVGLGNYLEFPFYLLTVYFGNGGFFIASLFDATVAHGEASYLIPMQSVIENWGAKEFGLRALMCERYVSCRFVWTPEVATLISIFGILAIPIVNTLLVQFGKFESFVLDNPSMPGMMLLYFVFVFCISLPTANFFLVSTPSIVAALVVVGVFVLRRRSRVN